MEIQRSLDALLYRNTTGNVPSPTWAIIDIVKEISINASVAEANMSVRGVTVEMTVPTLIKFGFDLTILYQPNNDHYKALLAACFGRTWIDLAVMNGDILVSGNDGARGPWGVYDWTREEPLEGGMMIKMKLKPFLHATPAGWLTIP